MTQPFLIFALPRSRTCWLANLFTTGSVFCYHDGLRLVREPPDLHELLEGDVLPPTTTHVGNCDNAMPIWAEQALRQYPEARVAIVQRDPRDVLSSLRRFHPEIEERVLERCVHVAQEGLDWLREHDAYHIEVGFNDLSDLSTLYALWVNLVPGVPFDLQRAKALTAMHIELHRPMYDRGITPEWAALANEVLEV